MSDNNKLYTSIGFRRIGLQYTQNCVADIYIYIHIYETKIVMVDIN
jgi:hypothetical protein